MSQWQAQARVEIEQRKRGQLRRAAMVNELYQRIKKQAITYVNRMSRADVIAHLDSELDPIFYKVNFSQRLYRERIVVNCQCMLYAIIRYDNDFAELKADCINSVPSPAGKRMIDALSVRAKILIESM